VLMRDIENSLERFKKLSVKQGLLTDGLNHRADLSPS
jgi:hypothetical protein